MQMLDRYSGSNTSYSLLHTPTLSISFHTHYNSNAHINSPALYPFYLTPIHSLSLAFQRYPKPALLPALRILLLHSACSVRILCNGGGSGGLPLIPRVHARPVHTPPTTHTHHCA